jgi:hypothetical protein
MLRFEVLILLFVMLLATHNSASAQQNDMIVRISEIEIDAQHLEKYKAILKEEAAAPVGLEAGVTNVLIIETT